MMYFGFETFFLNVPTKIDLTILHERENSNKTHGQHHALLKKYTFHGHLTAGYVLKQYLKLEAHIGITPFLADLTQENITIMGPLESQRPNIDGGIAAHGDFRYTLKKHMILGISSLVPINLPLSFLPYSFTRFTEKIYPFIGAHTALHYFKPTYQSNLNNLGLREISSHYFLRPSIGPCIGIDFALHPKWTARLQYRYECFLSLNISTSPEKNHSDNTLTQSVLFKTSSHYVGGGVFYNVEK
jgi:hypothetical protein